MKSLSTLVFPDTDIFSERLYPLLLFCTPLFYLQPVERSPEESSPDEPDIFIKSGLCQAHTPAPLGDDRARFLRLIGDIAQRRDDYAAQLSSLIVASMSSEKTESARENRSQIISSLFKERHSATDHDEATSALWQARLVLAIAEILSREEAELRQNLTQLDEQELEMYRSLQGESDQVEAGPFSEIERITAGLDLARPREMQMRFTSWLTLMRAAPIPGVSLWLASSQDGADQLLNEFDKHSTKEALPILKLALPDRIEASAAYVVSRVQDFHRAAAEVMEKLGNGLHQLALGELHSPASVDDLLPASSDDISRWNHLVENHFPAGSHGLGSLYFYLLPDCSISNLLDLSSPTAAAQPSHSLLGVVRRS